jgi:hypothetical protein
MGNPIVALVVLYFHYISCAKYTYIGLDGFRHRSQLGKLCAQASPLKIKGIDPT